jgi:tRNA/rRNA methyltransferase
MAAHALPIVQRTKIYETLREAVADCHYLLATSGHLHHPGKPVYSSRNFMQALPGSEPCKAGILFGRESSGLSHEDLTYAHALLRIPVDAACPSLNLAQAVNVVAYEWFLATDMAENAALQQNPALTKETQPATQAEIQAMFTQLETALDDANFWRVPQKKPAMWRNIRNFLQRRHATHQEVQTLRGMIRSLQRPHKN